MEDDTSTTPVPRERRRMPRAVSRLIVWVVVLGVLAALLIPSYMRERECARRTACLSNLKQLGLGLKQYAQDFEEKYPWQVGRTEPGESWRDLGLMYPNYVTAIGVYLCPSSKDRKFDPMCASGPKEDYAFEPFRDNRRERTSYGYCFDNMDAAKTTSWGENTKSTVRILADKKAGVAIGSSGNPVKKANHKDDGRMVLYQDGHAKWKSGIGALDPEPDDDEIGAPGLPDYTAWWSDPPYYGE
jgi:type II secretory pathway pseudopilin PulG